jgi:PKD repeat protein
MEKCNFLDSKQVKIFVLSVMIGLTLLWHAYATETVLTVHNYAEGDGPDNLVSNGIPFKPGVLFDEGKVRVLDGATEVPIAANVLAYWIYDNSIRVILIQFYADFAGETKDYTLEIGTQRTTTDITLTSVTWDLSKKIATLPAEYLCDSLVVWEQKPLGQTGFPEWDQKQLDNYYEIRDVGTASCANEDQYYNSIHSTYQIYARTGELDYVVNGRKWALHHRRDQIYLEGDLIGHGKCSSWEKTRYTYIQGLVDDYFFWGDEESKWVSGLIADHFYMLHSDSWYYKAPGERGAWTEREPAFALLGLVTHFEATNDQQYLDKAEERVDSLYQMQVDNGGTAWIHNLYDHDPSEGCSVDNWGSSPWMSGLLLEAIIKFHKLTGDANAEQSIFMALDYLKDNCLATTGSYAGKSFVYLGCPYRTIGTPDLDNMISHAYAYAYQLSGCTREDYRSLAITIFNTSVSYGGVYSSKHFNQQFRTSGHTVAYLASVSGNVYPLAIASASPTAGKAPLEVNFSSTGSSDPDGTIVSYEWHFGDGDTSDQENPIHIYSTGDDYTVTLTVTDNDEDTGTDSLTIAVAPADVTPPEISGVTSSDITDGTAVISWTTDELADSVVEYGTTTSYGSISSDPILRTSHVRTLTSLLPDTTYHYRVSSTDDSGNTANSDDFTFQTEPEDDSSIFSDIPGLGDTDNWAPLTTGYWEVAVDPVSSDKAYFLNDTARSDFEYTLFEVDTYENFTRTLRARTAEPSSNAWRDYLVIFGFQDSENYYYAFFNASVDSETNGIIKREDGDVTKISPYVPGTIVDDSYHDIEITREDNSITVKMDGDTKFTATDSTFGAGRIGLGSFNDSAYFDDVNVTPPTMVVLSGFAVAAGDGKVTLIWHTEAEMCNVGFAIYRRSNTRDGSYTRIAFISGAEDSETPNDYQFTDKQVQPGHTYYYYLEDVDIAGKRSRSDVIQISLPALLTQAQLLDNYPNPFNPGTWIPYNLAETADVTIRIYDARGHLIRILHLGHQPAGFYLSKGKAAYWDGRDDTGERVGSGVYFCRLSAGSFFDIRKMAILK